MKSHDKERETIISKLCAMIREELPKDQVEIVCKFARLYYSTVDGKELGALDTEDLYGALLSYWNFLYHADESTLKIRVYNPAFEHDGWQSTHTVVDIAQLDMPFVVDSTRMEINRQGYNIHFIIHGGNYYLKRDKQGHIIDVLAPDVIEDDVPKSAILHVEIDRQTDEEALKLLEDGIVNALTDVALAVKDWEAMRQRVSQALKDVDEHPKDLEPEDIAETKDFIRWIENDHYTFLGCRDYKLVQENGEYALQNIKGSGLGVLRDARTGVSSKSFSSLPIAARELLLSSQILIISKTNTRSTVHRPVYTDYIGIKKFNKKGEMIGELRIIGLYTSAAYNSSTKHIPFLRRKCNNVLLSSKLSPNSHSGKALINILETLPRDELFQSNEDELYSLAMGVLYIQERQQVRLFTRHEVYGRFVSCLVYVPREIFNTELRQIFQDILQRTYQALEISFETRFSDSVLARIYFIIRTDPNTLDAQSIQVADVEQELIEAARTWKDNLYDAFMDYYGEEHGNAMMVKYGSAFRASYRDDFLPRTAVFDVQHLEKLQDNLMLGMSFYRPIQARNGNIRLKLFHKDTTIPLSDVIPMLENMGLRIIGERPYEISTSNGEDYWINDFGMSLAENPELDVAAVKNIFQDAFSRIWRGKMANDGFNRLVLRAQLNWREVTVLRAYTKYLKQTGFTFSQAYIEDAVARNAHIVKLLLDLFVIRFDPHYQVQDNEVELLESRIHEELEKVTSLDEDRILQRLLDAIKATIRTNYFQKNANNEPKDYLSLKIQSGLIPDMPLPLPMYEIFVYSSHFEGIHLRSSKVARGGLRWSDRPEDFRTEILGLMKAQVVKNSVIVPSGAKGGFITKRILPHLSREEVQQEVVHCYKYFIRGLLDITDNRNGDNICPPKDVKCYDDVDPYLVVAADKGTATFSDIANEISKEYGFWLGDAFASGGCTGYDHKKMGITARGAWVSVQRHFREIGLNTQETNFTVVGIGDMSGDVFGNGMLLSHHIKLVAAFNHMHIFIDPDPDPEISFQERKRLFDLPRSSWEDYNPKLISKGGGIYKRSVKSIRLSKQIKQLLNIDKDILVPNELILYILKAKVDLLWNGGIGTYVKARSERHSEVGDRANDSIRINGAELRCQIIGEGGNLGLTQLGRIEFALKGGRVNTDFIDNSAGVDCSDHEVNIKILLNGIVEQGDMTEKQRNELLSEMTNEVARLVLNNNYYQTMALSMAQKRAKAYVELHNRYINSIEEQGKINRELECLPTSQQLMERKAHGDGLTHPELSTLISYAKSTLKEIILESDIPENEYLALLIFRAFPKTLRKQFSEEIKRHSLRREIIATQISNAVINEMGISFVHRLHNETGAPHAIVVRAYGVVRGLFGLPDIWHTIINLDNLVPTDIQYQMLIAVARLSRRATRWFLRNRRTCFDIEETIAEFTPGLKVLVNHAYDLVQGSDKQNAQQAIADYVNQGVPEHVAKGVAITNLLFTATDIIQAASEYDFATLDVARMYFALSSRLELGWLRDQITAHQVEGEWDALMREALRDDLDWQQRDLSIAILHEGEANDPLNKKIELWAAKHDILLARWERMLADLRSKQVCDFTMFSVAARELLDMTQTSFESVINQDENTSHDKKTRLKKESKQQKTTTDKE